MRKTVVCLWFGALAIAAPAQAPVSGDSGLVVIEGRAVVSPASGTTTLGFPGVTAHVTVVGSALSLHYTAHSESVMIDVQIEDEPFTRYHLTSGDHELVIFSGLPVTEREVRVVRRTEAWQGQLTIRGWQVEGGMLLPAAPLPERRLLFIGDSITAGAATDFREGDPDDGYHSSNGRFSYGYQLARMLDAQVHLVAFGGKGLVRDWRGMRADVTAPEYYERALPTAADTPWDASSWVPDAVFVCLGTNDFNQGIPDEQDWVAAYREFLLKIRRDAPEAPIFLLESPMQGDDPPALSRRVLRHYHEEVIEAVGDPNVHAIATGYHPGEQDAHPDQDGQRQIAAALLPQVQEKLGW